MKKITLAVLLLLSAFAWAQSANSAGYTINVHVSSSRMIVVGRAIVHQQELNVVIDGKKYELLSGAESSLLALGEYKAKLVKDEHRTTYDSLQVYEFLFPDQKTRKFLVVGQTE